MPLSFDYSGDPSLSDKDACRFLSGDTNEDDVLLSDEEHLYCISQESSVELAAARACEAIAAKFSRQADKEVGDLKLSYSQRSKAYFEMSKKLRSQSTTFCSPTAGGIIISEKQSNESDATLVKPSFFRNMHENAGTVASTANTESQDD